MRHKGNGQVTRQTDRPKKKTRDTMTETILKSANREKKENGEKREKNSNNAKQVLRRQKGREGVKRQQATKTHLS